MCNFADSKGNKPSPLQHDHMTADYYLIKLERFNQGMSQNELAKKAQISLKTLVNAEKGRSISAKTNKAIRDALGLK